jgi:DNA-binding CsgD family transcriptional regulator
MLLSGMSFNEIALALKPMSGPGLSLSKGTVLWHAQQVYKQHGVRSLAELLRKHGITPKLKKREEVRQRLTRGQSVAQIAREMGISRMCVYNHVYMLRRGGRFPPKLEVDKCPLVADNCRR